MLMRERGTGVSSLPLNTECHLLGIKYRPEYPAMFGCKHFLIAGDLANIHDTIFVE